METELKKVSEWIATNEKLTNDQVSAVFGLTIDSNGDCNGFMLGRYSIDELVMIKEGFDMLFKSALIHSILQDAINV